MVYLLCHDIKRRTMFPFHRTFCNSRKLKQICYKARSNVLNFFNASVVKSASKLTPYESVSY